MTALAWAEGGLTDDIKWAFGSAPLFKAGMFVGGLAGAGLLAFEIWHVRRNLGNRAG
jgi:hypothetical protein